MTGLCFFFFFRAVSRVTDEVAATHLYYELLIMQVLSQYNRFHLSLSWAAGEKMKRNLRAHQPPEGHSKAFQWEETGCVLRCTAAQNRSLEGSFHFSSVQSLSRVQLFVTPWAAAHQASLSITSSQSPPKPMSVESVMPSNHLILCRLLPLLSSIPPSIRVFSNESALHIRWLKYWSFSFSISPSNEHPGLISFRMDWLDLLQSKGLLRVFSNTTVQKHQFFCAQLSSQSNSHIHVWPLDKP